MDQPNILCGLTIEKFRDFFSRMSNNSLKFLDKQIEKKAEIFIQTFEGFVFLYNL